MKLMKRWAVASMGEGLLLDSNVVLELLVEEVGGDGDACPMLSCMSRQGC